MKTKDIQKKSYGTASIVLALVSIFVFWIPFFGLLICLLAVFLGIRALRKIRKDPKLKGKIRSVFAIIIGSILLFMGIIITIGALTFLASQRVPDLVNVTFETQDGDLLTFESAYEGQVYVYAEPFTDSLIVRDAIRENGGTIEESLENAGLYLVQVKAGEEASFLSALYDEDWFLDGSPAFPLVPDTIILYDSYSNSKDPTHCKDDHGNIVRIKAQRLGSSTKSIDIKKDLSKNNAITITKSIKKKMNDAKIKFERTVFSLSWGPKGSKISTEDSLGGCNSNQCRAVRQKRKIWCQTFFQFMETELKNNPKVANNALIVLSAGNSGASLDKEIAWLRKKFPNAAKRIQIVGSSDEAGDVHIDQNYMRDNSKGGVVYSLGKDVLIKNPETGTIVKCSGTSFATPEVSAVLDHIWTNNPGLTSDQVLSVLNKTLAKHGRNSVIPQVGGMTYQSFLDAADKIAKEIPVTEIKETPKIKPKEKPKTGTLVSGAPSCPSGNGGFSLGSSTASPGTNPIQYTPPSLIGPWGQEAQLSCSYTRDSGQGDGSEDYYENIIVIAEYQTSGTYEARPDWAKELYCTGQRNRRQKAYEDYFSASHVSKVTFTVLADWSGDIYSVTKGMGDELAAQIENAPYAITC